MMSVLQKELFVSKVDGECTNSNTKTRESSLESVQTAKFGPRISEASLLAQGFDIFIWDVLILLVKILNIEIFIGEFFGGNIHTATK
jgi:hypothetical protein